MRIIVVGTGPIGGIVGGRLARAGHNPTFVDVDREHVSAIRANGLQVDVPDGPFRVNIKIVFPNEIEDTFDLALIAVRSNYTEDALNTILPHLSRDGLLVSLQNGINPPRLEERVGSDRAVGVAIRMGCVKVAPGHVRTAVRGHLYLGHVNGKLTPQLERLHALLNAVIPSEMTDNILGVLWSKLTYTCLGFFGSLADAPLATSCADKPCRLLLADFLGEVVAAGKAGGTRFIPLKEYDPEDFDPASYPVEKRLGAVNAMAKSWKDDDRKGPLRQIQRGVKTEADYTLGHVVRQGEQFGVPTPVSRRLLQMIHELENGTRKLALENYKELRAAAGPRTD